VTGEDLEKKISIELLYTNGDSRIRGMERVSKPGRRLYTGAHDLKPYKQGKGSWIISTPTGILTDRQARKENKGGEILFRIW